MLALTQVRVAPGASGPWVSPLYPQNGVPLWGRIWLSPETDPRAFLLGTTILLHAPATGALMRSESPDSEIPARYRDLQDVAAAARPARAGSQYEETRPDRWSNAPASIGSTSPPEATPVTPADEVSSTGAGDRRRDLAVMTAMIGRRHAATVLTLQPYQLSLGPEVSPASAATPEARH